MGKIKITQEHEKCIGCGACAAICSQYWEMNDKGKAILKGAKKAGDKFTLEIASIGCNKEAADACPVNCIHIEDNGKKII
jgi:ferredoxin